jgi:hypothetical protein
MTTRQPPPSCRKRVCCSLLKSRHHQHHFFVGKPQGKTTTHNYVFLKTQIIMLLTMFPHRRSLSCYCAFLSIIAVKSLSTNAGGWSETALKAAKDLTLSQKKKLLEEEGVIRKRHVTIKAERLGNNPEQWMRDNSTEGENGFSVVTKVIHFQRHGQGKIH